ncbi:MAG TPA: Vi polysaccharide biosynthesis UDP-N-acetylglucosamine C-6 dehydrogenase TviB, partial [Propionibacterium sp.]|nr:Vi polysaccharide biosynthesis UDP-N-acetylglucosamine C-6 dehydrogenase TviB [Propionibacterium sp.]
DLRNTRVVDIIAELEDYGISVDVHDPWADPDEARQHYGIALVEEPDAGAYDGIVLAVAHQPLRTWPVLLLLASARSTDTCCTISRAC